MRRMTLALVLVLIVFAVPAQAQLAPKVGLIGGANLTNFELKDSAASIDPIYHGQVVPGIGVTLTSRPFDRFAVRMDLMWLQKGQTISESVFLIPASLDLNYFEIPLLAVFDLKGGSIRPYVLGGPSVGLLLGAYIHYEGPDDDQKFSEDIKRAFNSVDFSLAGGAGVAWQTSRSRVYIETRYLRGLTNIEICDASSVVCGTRSTKTRGLQIMLGVTAR